MYFKMFFSMWFGRRRRKRRKRKCDPKLLNPGPITITMKENEEMADVINFSVVLPELTDVGDVESGELTVTVGSGDPQVVTTAVGDTEVGGLSGAQGETVALSFVYVDDAGNRSEEPSILTTVLQDTVPPQNPQSLGVRIEGEV